ncbi:similar to Saccharomyces cerevisiae YDR169C STB3 Ribosomal RNA processing element (RRPE)-binding protein involved in the glucose-induced transition from quiescence to growth [Maudiozyma saulgeensis]|uniref:Similar to Saccharomyces cerevisiae YDR169C STB3 Ribosomal RNA processing element (RRPE)-binding protein involved in the glucose-induced transition from quiescence to growth n=1 Tax=Maudiozyma saulgeensis TaxID=1789683 RepID=A0A1X7R4S4_9SACH|nr:similar to Saccharomyces cerevisiae YDR169C STB3 Ribosomal RNA processing element (RRPE)-binding protein involved in the glucose-induced transition from quiescence to growth [Kazachstania saulgeensis]
MVTEQIRITKRVGTNPEYTDNGSKPLPITSVEAQNAVHMVTPERISKMLETRGPLAIRFITQSLSEEIPYFKNLSTSKQRRLIMNVMETGFEEQSLIFEKIGWGLWTVRKVLPEAFRQEREMTNKLNAKVRDNSNNPNAPEVKRRLSSNNTRKKSQVESMSVPLSPKLKAQGQLPNGARSVVYIDENVLQTDEDDNDVFSEEDYDEGHVMSNNNHNHNSNGNNNVNKIKNEHEDFVHEMIRPNGAFNFNRRKSSVVYDDTMPEALEQEMLAQKIRPLLKNKSRRSSSKGRPVHIFNNSNTSNNNNNNNNNNGSHNTESIIGSPLSGKHILDNENIPPLPKVLYSSEDSNINQNNFPLRKGSISGLNNDLKPGRNSFSEDVSRRSSSRLSVSKESGIRSTLFHTLNDISAQGSNNSATSLGNRSQMGVFQSPGLPIIEQKDQIIALANNNNSKKNVSDSNIPMTNTNTIESPHSDTDEEDWANIGAESLRTMSNDISPITTNKLATHTNNTGDADDAARVLLSLK